MFGQVQTASAFSSYIYAARFLCLVESVREVYHAATGWEGSVAASRRVRCASQGVTNTLPTRTQPSGMGRRLRPAGVFPLARSPTPKRRVVMTDISAWAVSAHVLPPGTTAARLCSPCCARDHFTRKTFLIVGRVMIHFASRRCLQLARARAPHH